VPLVSRVVAPNPGPYTTGTNTWIVDAGPVAIVIDPGPDDEEHLNAIEKRLGSAAVGVVLVTIPIPTTASRRAPCLAPSRVREALPRAR